MPFIVTYYRDGEELETTNSAATLADIRSAAHEGLVQRDAERLRNPIVRLPRRNGE